MAQSYLIFDFGTDEKAAQQARHRIEGWKQAFRLGKKLECKFERQPEDEAEKPEKKESEKTEWGGAVRMLVRLDFSDHERLSFQRWLDRIPAEEPFKSAKSEVIRQNEALFEKTAETFDSLS